jgi:hypothetical protein
VSNPSVRTSPRVVLATRTPEPDLIAAIPAVIPYDLGDLHGPHAAELPVLKIAIGPILCEDLAHFGLDFIDDLRTRAQLARTARLGLEAN